MADPTTKTKSLRELIQSAQVLVDKLGRLTHAGVAMVVGAALDQLLEEALTTKLVHANRETRDKLFGEYGALQTFSAKIDLSFALGVVDRKAYTNLTIIRKVRNCFAHADGFLDFDAPTVRKFFQPTPTKEPSKSPIDHFIGIAGEIETSVNATCGLPSRGLIEKVKTDF
jgi:hypothetical protein